MWSTDCDYATGACFSPVAVRKTHWLRFLFLFFFRRFFYHRKTLILHNVLGGQEVLHELLALDRSKSANVNVTGTLPKRVAGFTTPIASERRGLIAGRVTSWWYERGVWERQADGRPLRSALVVVFDQMALGFTMENFVKYVDP
jgi:hypothetical protein